MQRAVILAILCLLPRAVLADGNELLKRCTSYLNVLEKKELPTEDEERVAAAFEGGYCLGFVQGVMNTGLYYQMVGEVFGKFRPAFCLPRQMVPYGQGIRVLLAYLQKHPEKLHEAEFDLALLAFGEAFLCPTQKPVTPRRR